MESVLGSNCVIANDFLNTDSTGVTHYYHAQLGVTDKGPATIGLVIFNSLDLELLDLLNGQVLGCYQPSPEV